MGNILVAMNTTLVEESSLSPLRTTFISATSPSKMLHPWKTLSDPISLTRLILAPSIALT